MSRQTKYKKSDKEVKQESIIKDKRETKKPIKLLIRAFIFLIIGCCSIILYSRYIATTGLYVKEYKVTSSGLPDSFHGFKIVHISDIHYGTTIHKKELEKLVEKINYLKPDIVLLTGDLFNQSVKIDNDTEKEIINTLNSIETKIGKYAISGDNDYKYSNWESVINSSGFINLNDNYDLIYNGSNEYITITGISNNTYGDVALTDKLNTTTEFINNNLAQNQNYNVYKILLMHEPDYINEIKNINFDLVLAGHSLNGQIKIPLIGRIFVPKGAKKYYDTYYELDNTKIFISSGIGTTDTKFRLFNRPSFNFYRLMKK